MGSVGVMVMGSSSGGMRTSKLRYRWWLNKAEAPYAAELHISRGELDTL